MYFTVNRSQLSGEISVPSSKSHTIRAIYFAALATGTSRIDDFLLSPDSAAMIEAVRMLGAKVEVDGTSLNIAGFAGKPTVPDDVIDCGNSGLVLRFIGALAGLIPHYTILTGDSSIRHNRPVKPLLTALTQLGAIAFSTRRAPIVVKGPWKKSVATLDGADSQPVSGLLIAGAFSPHPIEIYVKNPGEKPWIEMTLHWFDRLGISYTRKGFEYYKMEGRSLIKPFHYRVPGDFSSAAFPIVAALITHSELTLHNIEMDDVQGDKAIIPILEKMGARFTIEKRSLTVHRSTLKGIQIDVNDFIDALPILAVAGCFAEGRTEIINGAIARNKESDRISAMCAELKKMGARIEERPDGLIIQPTTLQSAEVESYSDHRVAMSLAVAAMAANGQTIVHGASAVAKTFPHFHTAFKSIGAFIEHHTLRV